MRNKIIFGGKADLWKKGMISAAINAALSCEEAGLSCEINVLLTDDEGIKQLNREFRGKDEATDVLSFPAQELSAGEKPQVYMRDPGTKRVPLGDMAINLDRAKEQAVQFGHSAEREIQYLTVHSVLHLLGYDHLDEGPEKRLMREREEAVMEKLGRKR